MRIDVLVWATLFGAGLSTILCHGCTFGRDGLSQRRKGRVHLRQRNDAFGFGGFSDGLKDAFANGLGHHHRPGGPAFELIDHDRSSLSVDRLDNISP
jgi:hypothetical protein